MKEGGDFYVLYSAVVQIKNSNVAKSTAQNGLFIYSNDLLNSTLGLEGVRVSNITSTVEDAVLIHSSKGSLQAVNSTIEDVNIPLFKFKEMLVTFDGLLIRQIHCKASVPCLIEGTSVDLDIMNTRVSDIIANNPVIAITQSNKLRMFDAQFLKMELFSKTSPSYAIQVWGIKNVTIEESLFQSINSSFLFFRQSDLLISYTLFMNKDQISSRPMNFITLEDTNTVIIGSTFSGAKSSAELSRGVMSFQAQLFLFL